jgi:hypothetical protein
MGYIAVHFGLRYSEGGARSYESRLNTQHLLISAQTLLFSLITIFLHLVSTVSENIGFLGCHANSLVDSNISEESATSMLRVEQIGVGAAISYKIFFFIWTVRL